MFYRVMDWVETQASKTDVVQFNCVGDVLCLPNSQEYLDRIKVCPLPKAMTTNGLFLKELPDVDQLVISFNGGTLEAHRLVTGMDSEVVLENIRRLYPKMVGKAVEIHCLICKLNEGTEENLLRIFEGFPGKIRVSYKCENQGGTQDWTLKGFVVTERIPCDYLDGIVIDASGKIIQCSHDFEAITDFGRVGEPVSDLLKNGERLRKRAAHRTGVFTGLCARCNYNVPVTNQIVYLK